MFLCQGVEEAERLQKQEKKAEESIEYLSTLILESDKDISNLAARDLLRVSKRHGVRAERKVRDLIYRSCNSILRPGDGSGLEFITVFED